MTAPGIFWLTRDFRLRDNPALLAALRDGPLLPVFFVDQQLKSQGAASRWRLQQALVAFDAALKSRTGGVGVTVIEAEPDAALPQLLRSTGAKRVHQSDWPAPQMRAVQARVEAQLGADRLRLYPGHLLVHPAALQRGAGGAYRVYTPFARALQRHGADLPEADAPARIEPFRGSLPAGLTLRDPASLTLAPDLHGGRAALERFALPAGEAAALARLETFFGTIASYPEGRDRPDLEVTSELSDYLALGEISPRSVWAAAGLYAQLHPVAAAGISKFLSEVIWREFAWHLLIAFPQLPSACWRPEWEGFAWAKDGPQLELWRQARTGVALVDAGLRQMWLTGRMHNRVRMVVASYLTKHLLTDWRAGLAHFEDCLTDWDPASNAMNWQWVAGCGPDASPYFRVFNPELQAQKFDPHGTYRRRWLTARTGDAAELWPASIPPRWRAQSWQPVGPGELAAGRGRALGALEAFRAGSPAQPAD